LGLSIFLCITLLVPFSCTKKESIPVEIVIGGPASLTGMYAGFGQAAVFGMKAAVEDINKNGGIYLKELDKKLLLKLITNDCESDPQKAGTLAEQLIVQNNVNFLIMGGEPPVMGPPVSNIADRYKVPFVYGAGPMEPWLAQRQEVEGHWQYTWAFGFPIVTPAPEGSPFSNPGYTVLANWKVMLDKFGDQTNKTIAVFASADPDGVSWYGLFPELLKEWGYKVVGVDKKLGLVPADTTDFSSIINEWKNNNCEILWGNAPAPVFGTLWKQCAALGFKPKMASIGRAPMFYEDITSWGGDLPLGICLEVWGDPSLTDSRGIGGTTLETLAEKWTRDTGKPLNRSIGSGYRSVQVLADAIERAGSLDREKVQSALGQTDGTFIMSRVKFDQNHFSYEPLALGQWQKTDKSWTWECPVIFSLLDIIEPTADPIFPIPGK